MSPTHSDPNGKLGLCVQRAARTTGHCHAKRMIAVCEESPISSDSILNTPMMESWISCMDCGPLPLIAAVAAGYVRLRRVVSLHDHVPSMPRSPSAVAPFDAGRCPAMCTTKFSRARAIRSSSVVWSSLPCAQVSQSLVHRRRTWRVYMVNLPRSAKRSERNTLIQLSLAWSLS